jgi:hypothetical protein
MSNTHIINQSGVNDIDPLSIMMRLAADDFKLQGTSWFLDPFHR